MSMIVGKVIPSLSTVPATVERLADGNGVLWVRLVNGSSLPSAASLKYKIIDEDIAANSEEIIDLTDNIGGGLLRFINLDGSAPSGVLKIYDDANDTYFTILPRESVELPSGLSQLILSASTNSHYQIKYYIAT